MNRLCILLLSSASLLCGCANKPPERPSFNRFSAPSVGGTAATNMNGFLGSGSWHPGNASVRPGSDYIKGMKGF